MSQTKISDIAFTPAVKQVQDRLGSRRIYAQAAEHNDWANEITPELAAFLAERDSFYLATASADGRPYIQHRGGPSGFLRVVDNKTLAFADFSGNRQYVSIGNLEENDQAFLFLMDYANQRRIKIWGRAEVIEDDPELARKLADPAYPGKIERVFRFTVEAWDVNCRKHIKPRFTTEEISGQIEALIARISALEAENERLRAQSSSLAR